MMEKDNCAKGNKEKFFITATKDELKTDIIKHLQFSLGREQKSATIHDWCDAVCLAIRDKIMSRFIKTQQLHHKKNVKRVYYMSLEYLTGSMLKNNMCCLGLLEEARGAIEDLGLNFEELTNTEKDMGLGNGGLGRLAACFQDSLATLNYPAIGYGINYEFGLFKQLIKDGKQVEKPDNWRTFGTPWEIRRPKDAQTIKLTGKVEDYYDDHGNWRQRWVDARQVLGIPWDVPVVGYSGETVNFIRLWESKPAKEFDFEEFNNGGYVEAVQQHVVGETISKILYPNDATVTGKALRLIQQYFFVACSIMDIIRRHKEYNHSLATLPEQAAIQLNDTHPTIAIVELMRILVDEECMDWEEAWAMCRKIFGYTNHTLLPEALEEWPVEIFKKILPRHYQLVCEINRRFLEEEVGKKWPHDDNKKRELTIITDGANPRIRMAYLAVVGSASVNGVAEMHSALVKKDLFPAFNELYPGKFTNKTNGITPRRWLRMSNPGLSKLIDRTIGCDWTANLSKLAELKKYADNPAFQKQFHQIKLENKIKLAKFIKDTQGLDINPESIFDVQIKRLHEYKRQHLNLLHILYLYRKLLSDSKNTEIYPRTFIFAAKAAPGYFAAKNIIYAINAAAKFINNNKSIVGKLKVVFLPNYSVSLAEKIIPAADVSEQISTAGKEASGTGNMKLALNGACTIGTLDGANVEIKEEVGAENIFIFGKTYTEIKQAKQNGYNPYDVYNNNPELKQIIDWMGSDYFKLENGDNPIKDVHDMLLSGGDPYFALLDFEDYVAKHNEINKTYKIRDIWLKKSILNTALVGKFSSDRTIEDYAKEIWKLDKIHIK